MGKILAFVNMVGFVMQYNLGKKPNSPKQVLGASRAFACRQTCRRERWLCGRCVGWHGQSQLDLTSPFNFVLRGYFLSPGNAVKSQNQSGDG